MSKHYKAMVNATEDFQEIETNKNHAMTWWLTWNLQSFNHFTKYTMTSLSWYRLGLIKTTSFLWNNNKVVILRRHELTKSTSIITIP